MIDAGIAHRHARDSLSIRDDELDLLDTDAFAEVANALNTIGRMAGVTIYENAGPRELGRYEIKADWPTPCITTLGNTATVDEPPQHANCRSTTEPVVDFAAKLQAIVDESRRIMYGDVR